MKTNYLKIKNLEKKLGNFLIRKISFELKKGEIIQRLPQEELLEYFLKEVEEEAKKYQQKEKNE